MSDIQQRLKTVAFYIFIGLLAYVPLHILISTWLGTSFHMLEIAKVLKDIVLVVGFVCALGASVGASWFMPLLRRKIVLIILVYAALTVLLALLLPTETDAEVLGVVYNLRFLLMFLYALLLAHLFDVAYVRRHAVKTAIVVGVIVALFGVVQYTLLPDTALAHIGYSRANGVLPAFFIDDKPDFERVMSTLRDPNSLGSYLLIIGALLAALWIKVKNRDLRIMFTGSGVLVGLCLVFTFSRSAWMGALVTAGVFMLGYVLRNKTITQWVHAHKQVFIVGAVATVVLIGGLFVAKDSYVVQNVLFHADKSTVLEDPNELRVRFWRESVQASIENPLGHGPGTAGLASIRNQTQGTVLTENYYLQLLYEVGFIGLLIFLVILAGTAWLLYITYIKSDNLIALALLAAFAGLAVTNFLVHIWANEAVAYTFWGLAGLYVITQKPTKGKLKLVKS